MRYVLAVIVATLVVTISGTGAGEEQHPASGARVCSTPADPQWLPQEKFVWQHVCVGEPANFNKGPEYGGELAWGGRKAYRRAGF